MILRRNTKNLNQFFSVVTSSFVFLIALLLCDVDVLEGSLMVLILSFQTFSGMLIYYRLTNSRISLSAEPLAMGFAIGAFLSMAGDQALMHSRFSKVGWLLPVVIGVLPLIKKKYAKPLQVEKRENSLALPWAVAGAFVSLGIEWYWTFPIGLSFALLLWIIETRNTHSVIKNTRVPLVVSFAVLTFLTCSMIWCRPKIWWMHHWYDYYQFENWSSGLAYFGTNGISGLGYEFKYHWFSYAWNGLFSRLSNAQPWVATTRASVLVGAVAIQLFFMAIIEHYGHKTLQARKMSVLLATFTTVAIWNRQSFHVIHLESFSLFFSLIWLFAAYFAILRMRNSFTYGGAILVVLSSVASVGGKSSFGLLAACMVFALAVEVLVNDRKRCLPYFSLALVNLLLLMMCIRLWLVDSSVPKIYLPSIGFLHFLGDMRSENLIFRKPETLILAAAFFSGVFLLHAFGLIIFVKDIFIKVKKLYFIEILVWLAGVLFVSAITFYAASQIYIAYGIYVLFLPLLGSVLLAQVANLDLKKVILFHYKRSILLVFLIFVFTIGSSFWPLRFIDVNTPSKVFIRQLPYLGTLFISVSVLLLFGKFGMRRKRYFQRILPVLIIVSLATSSVSFYMIEWTAKIRSSFAGLRREEALNSRLQFGLFAEREVAEWINRFSPRESVIASNYMYSECDGCLGNFKPINSRLPIEVEIFEGLLHRRLLLRQQNFNNAGIEVVNSPRINDLRVKKQTVSYFINTGEKAALLKLKKYGVDLILVSLNDTSRRDWGVSSKVIFENSRFLILDISDIDF